MKTRIAGLLLLLVSAACESTQPSGYVTLTLPDTARVGAFVPSAATAALTPGEVKSWKITVSAEDMDEPVIVTTDDREVTIPVKAGAGRLVHVSGRGASADGITQGYDGETVVDVPEEAHAEAVVDVFRSVTVSDDNAPLGAGGKEAPATAPDIHELTLTIGTDEVALFITFKNDVAAPWNSSRDNSIKGLVEFDTDRSTQTGGLSLVQSRQAKTRAAAIDAVADQRLGVDLTVDFTPVSSGFVRLLVNDVAKPVAARFGAKTLSVSVPLSEFGAELKGLRFVALAADRRGSADFIPEKDFVEIALDPAPLAEPGLAHVTAFERNFITAFTNGDVAPAPVVVGSPVGIHAAWTNGTGVDYLASTDGKQFSTVGTVALPRGETPAMMNGYGPNPLDLAVDKQGRATVVLTVELPCTVQCTSPSYGGRIFQDAGNGFLPAIATTPLLDFLDRRALVANAQNGSTVVITPFGMSAGGDMLVVSEGKIIGTMPAPPSFRTSYELGVTPFGDGLLFVGDGYGAGPVLVKSVATVSAGKVVASEMASFATLPTSGNIDVAASGQKIYALVSSMSDIFVYGADGKTIPFPTAVLETGVGADVAAYPQIAVSGTGRVGVVWHSGPYVMYEPGGGPLAAPSVDRSEIYYSELLPGETKFGDPVLVGPGSHADIAFDALDRPVIVVSHLSFTMDATQMPRLSSAYVYSYRGK